jgi:SAM-dependent methyltransferase
MNFLKIDKYVIRKHYMPNHTITKIDSNRWKQAQKFELSFAHRNVNKGDDHNYWWRKQFENYQVLRNLEFPNVLEVGCGPHTNVRMILPFIKFQNLFLEDPLIHAYLGLKKTFHFAWPLKMFPSVEVTRLHKKYRASLLIEPLEELSLSDESIDLCICINVLDHVQDTDMCIQQMRRVTKKEGIIILGQDLSNEEDMMLCPESWVDAGHPIKIDDVYLDIQLGDLHPLYKKILPREQGRNPRCHYATYFLIAKR